MSTATITFDLNDSDDRKHHLRCVKSTDMAVILFELIHNGKKTCRQRISDEGVESGMDTVFEYIQELIAEHGVVIEDLIN